MSPSVGQLLSPQRMIDRARVPSAPRHDNVQLAALLSPVPPAERWSLWSKRHRAGIPLQARGGLGGGKRGLPPLGIRRSLRRRVI